MTGARRSFGWTGDRDIGKNVEEKRESEREREREHYNGRGAGEERVREEGEGRRRRKRRIKMEREFTAEEEAPMLSTSSKFLRRRW